MMTIFVRRGIVLKETRLKELIITSNNNPKDICTLSSVVEHGAYDAAAMGSIPIGCTKSCKCGFNSTMSF